jgi:hypothetical protein
MSKYPKFLLRRVAVNTTGPVYFESYNGEQATFDAYERAIDGGDIAEILDYRYPDPEEFCEMRAIYDGEHRSYSVAFDMISDCSALEPVMIRLFID